MKTKAGQSNRFVRIFTTPFRALCKARDYYVNSMLNCANMNAIGLQRTSQYTASLPRSFSAASSRSNNDEDYRELVRAASARSAGSRVDMDVYVTKMKPGSGSGPRALPPRSISVAMGRIDEESYFGEEGNNGINIVDVKNELKYPRSKSHAVGRTPF